MKYAKLHYRENQTPHQDLFSSRRGLKESWKQLLVLVCHRGWEFGSRVLELQQLVASGWIRVVAAFFGNGEWGMG